MGAIDKNSVRQRIISLEIGGKAVFPVERRPYVSKVAYGIAKELKRKYTCPTTENRITVIRLQ